MGTPNPDGWTDANLVAVDSFGKLTSKPATKIHNLFAPVTSIDIDHWHRLCGFYLIRRSYGRDKEEN